MRGEAGHGFYEFAKSRGCEMEAWGWFIAGLIIGGVVALIVVCALVGSRRSESADMLDSH